MMLAASSALMRRSSFHKKVKDSYGHMADDEVFQEVRLGCKVQFGHTMLPPIRAEKSS